MKQTHDILILGGGPIGASTAFSLAERGAKNIGLITESVDTSAGAAYLNSGGSIRWFWDDPLKSEMTKETADFISRLEAEGADLLLNRDHYLFLARGVFVPSLNVSGTKLVSWLLDASAQKGVNIRRDEKVLSVDECDGMFLVKTTKEEYLSKKVLCALGPDNRNFFPGYQVKFEKRQLFMLDIVVGNNEEKFPHTIIPIKDGVAYVFVKKTDSGFKFFVGQEDVIAMSDEPKPEDHFEELLNSGLGKLMPFLKKANVEKVLWGFDAVNKTLKLEDQDNRLFAANCGSAVRSCAWIGRTIADRLLS